jgi:curved DNA-binding protein CbpA
VALASKATDWWVILGVAPNATLDEVNSRFKELARINHPDVGGNLAEFQRISEARHAASAALGRRS